MFVFRRSIRLAVLVAVFALLVLLPLAIAIAATAPDLTADVTAVMAMPNSYVAWATLIVAIASIFCASTSTPSAGSPWAIPYKVIEFLAVNFGKAKQAVALFLVFALIGLAACTPQQLATAQIKIQAIEVQAVQAADMFCKVDLQVVPFVQAGASMASVVVPQAGPLVALDVTTVHPDIVAACTKIGGILVAPPKS